MEKGRFTRMESKISESLSFYEQGNQLLNQGIYQEALTAFQTSYQLASTEMEHYSLLILKMVLCLKELKFSTQALNLLNENIVLFPRFLDLFYLRGLLYHQLRYYTLAIESLESCLKLDDEATYDLFMMGVESYRTYYALGTIYQELGDYQNALVNYQHILKSQPDFQDTKYRIGKIILQENTLEEGLTQLENFFDSSSAEGLEDIANLLVAEKFYGSAINYLDKNISLLDSSDKLLYLKSLCLFNSNCYKEARKELKRIGFESAYYYSALDLLCWCYWQEKRYKESSRIIKTLEKVSPSQELHWIYKNFNEILEGKENLSSLPINNKNISEWSDELLKFLERMAEFKDWKYFNKALILTQLIQDLELNNKLGKLFYKLEMNELAQRYLLDSIENKGFYDFETFFILERIYQNSVKQENEE